MAKIIVNNENKKSTIAPAESVGVLSMTEKGGMTVYGRKH